MTTVTVQEETTVVTVQEETTVVTVQDATIAVLTVAEQGPPGPPGAGDMEALIYDPRGIREDCFDLTHLTGVLDAGLFT